MRGSSADFVAFISVGAINTALTYAVFLLLLGALHYLWAFTTAFAIGIAVSYVLNTRLVFKTKHEMRTLIRFPLIYIFQYFYGSVLLWFLIGILSISKPLAMLVMLASSALVTFFLMRYLFHVSSLRAGPQRRAEKPT